MSEAELLEHRAAITAKRPSLPRQAGRVLAKMYARSALLSLERVRAKNRVPTTTAAKRPKQGDRILTVRAVVRPEIDATKLARAFIRIAENAARREASDRNNPDGY